MFATRAIDPRTPVAAEDQSSHRKTETGGFGSGRRPSFDAMDDKIGLDDAYALQTPDDVKRLYERWADTFDNEFIAAHNYVYHRQVIGVLLARAELEADEAILDVGCGTGVGGVELRRYRSWPVDGLDLSAGMLAKAADKVDDDGHPVYRRLFEADVLEPLPLSPRGYGAVFSIGTFTHGHVGPEAIDQLVTLAKPGGLLCLGINEEFHDQAGFTEHFRRLVESGRISDPDYTRVPIYEADSGHPHAEDNALVVTFSPMT